MPSVELEGGLGSSGQESVEAGSEITVGAEYPEVAV